MMSDFKFTLRRLAKTPGFTAIALLTLALCVGSNLTIFAVIDAVLLRPLPFPQPEQLVTLYNTFPKAGIERGNGSLTNYYERRGNIAALSNSSAYENGSANIGEAGATTHESLLRISPDFFATLGVGPLIGRAFTEGEMTRQTDNEAIVSDAYWRQHFNADPRALGRKVTVNGVQKTVVGILPPGFRMLSFEGPLLLPLSSELSERAVDHRYWGNAELIARLRPGATVGEAQAQIDAHNAAHAAEFSFAKMVEAAGFRTIVAPLHADYIRNVRPTLFLMQGGALILLAIGTVNIANLLLIRAGARSKEYAIRQSLGANRWHVVREALLETVALTLAGGMLGTITGAWGIRLLALLGADHLPLGEHVTMSGRLALLSVLASAALGAAIALPVAWYNLSNHLANTLKAESRGGTAGRGAQRLRSMFIVAQIALAFVLLGGAGMLASSLRRTMAISPGFRPDHVLTAQIALPWETYKDNTARLAFADMLVDKAEQLPGVTAAGIVTYLPVQGSAGTGNVTVIGYVPKEGAPPDVDTYFGVAGDYFSALGIPLRSGRYIGSADSRRSEKVAVVDENFAHHYWPAGNAVGQRFFEGLPENKAPSEAFTIVGVVGDVKQSALTEVHPHEAIYFPFVYHTDNISVVVHTTLSPEFLTTSLRGVVHDIDASLPLDDVRPMDVRIADSLQDQRSPLLLTGIFALVSLLLAGIGTYGVLSYAVAQRRREIGVRMALGAQPSQICIQFLSIGLGQLALGTAIGAFGTWLAGRAMGGILFNAPGLPLGTMVATALVMAIVSLGACLVPARRAAHVSPMEALGGD